MRPTDVSFSPRWLKQWHKNERMRGSIRIDSAELFAAQGLIR
jgi:hypothetical protein